MPIPMTRLDITEAERVALFTRLIDVIDDEDAMGRVTSAAVLAVMLIDSARKRGEEAGVQEVIVSAVASARVVLPAWRAALQRVQAEHARIVDGEAWYRGMQILHSKVFEPFEARVEASRKHVEFIATRLAEAEEILTRFAPDRGLFAIDVAGRLAATAAPAVGPGAVGAEAAEHGPQPSKAGVA